MQAALERGGMEELVDAAALAIGFLGEAALNSSAAQLVALAARVPFPFDVVDVGAHRELRDAAYELQQVEAGDALEQVDAASRSAAVRRLGDAAAALAGALGVHAEALRVAAADLARACGEYRAAADALQKVRSAPVPQTERAPWWSPRRWDWRRGAHAEKKSPLDVPFLAQASDQEKVNESSDIFVAADFLSKTMDIIDLVKTANDVKHAADESGVEHELDKYVIALEQPQAGATSSVAVIIGLGEAATRLEQRASSWVNSLRGPAARLARDCQEHQKGATAMAAVQYAAAKLAQQREGTKGGQLEEAPCLGKGDERRSPMLGFAIYGTYALVSSVSPITGKTLRTLSSDVLWHIHIWVTMWWSILLIGSGCSSHGRSWWELLIAKIASRIGMFGINMMFIFFSYWILDIKDKTVFYVLPSVVTVLHLFFLFVTGRRGDL